MSKATTQPPVMIRAERGRRVRVEFMPGRVTEVPAITVAGIPKFVMCRLAKQPNGTYAMIPEGWDQMVRMTRKLHAELGLHCSYRTIYSLVKSGFVRGSLLSPQTIMVDLGSLAEHIRRTELGEGKPTFWTKARIDRYRYSVAGADGASDDEEADEDV